MTIASEPEVTLSVHDGVDWHYSGGDSTLLYDPRFRFPVEELVALAREHAASCPGLVHRDLRRHMDAEDVARAFRLQGAGAGSGVGGSGGGGSAGFAADDGVMTTEGDYAVFDQEPSGYVTVDEPAEELVDYVVVGTADEVEREQRREADAEDRDRSIEELSEDAGVEAEAASTNDPSFVEQLSDLDEAGDDEEEEDALTARRKKLIRDIDRALEEEGALDVGWNVVARTIEKHFASADNDATVPE